MKSMIDGVDYHRYYRLNRRVGWKKIEGLPLFPAISAIRGKAHAVVGVDGGMLDLRAWLYLGGSCLQLAQDAVYRLPVVFFGQWPQHPDEGREAEAWFSLVLESLQDAATFFHVFVFQ